MRNFVLLVAVAAFACGCSSVAVKPVRWAPDTGRKVCVKENPVVVDPDLLPAIQAALVRNHVAGETYPGKDFQGEQPEVLAAPEEIPAGCDYVLTYVGFVWWDIAMYLLRAEFRVQDRSYAEVGFGSYSLSAHGGLDLSKFSSTEKKVGPVLDDMLRGVPR